MTDHLIVLLGDARLVEAIIWRARRCARVMEGALRNRKDPE